MAHQRLLRLLLAALLAVVGSVSVACSDDADPQGPHGFGGSGGTGGTSSVLCATTFHFQPPPGVAPSSVALAGEWNEFDATALMEGPDSSGAFSLTVDLAPGMWGYKLVLDGDNWMLDPDQGYRKYVGGEENSAVRVLDCSVPRLSVATKAVGAGTYTATIEFAAANSGDALASAGVKLRFADSETDVAASSVSVDAAAKTISLSLDGLTDGKYTAYVTAKDAGGAESEPLAAGVLDRARGLRLAGRADLHDHDGPLQRRRSVATIRRPPAACRIRAGTTKGVIWKACARRSPTARWTSSACAPCG